MGGLVKAKKGTNSMTMRQMRFIVAYKDTLSVKKAADEAGMKLCEVWAAARREGTLFSKTFRETTESIAKDPRFGKVAGLERLLRYQEALEANEDYLGAAKIQQQINTMVEGNIAIQNRAEEKKEVTIKVIDFTQKPKQLTTGDYIDITAEEVYE